MKVSIYCPFCEQHTSLRMAGAKYETSYEVKYVAALWKNDMGEEWWIGICNYCDRPMLVRNNGDVIYPESLPSPTDKRIPEHVRKDLIEAKFCFSIKAYRACAVMARRCMQTTCIDKGAKSKDLVSQLNELKSIGLITKEIKEWADVVRWVGNDAAHPNKNEVTAIEAEDILKLSEQFLNIIYVAVAIANERTTARKK